MPRLFCAHCGDQLKPVRRMVVTWSPIRMVLLDLGLEWRHTTRRYDESFRPDVVSAAQIFRRFARARVHAH